MRLLVPKRVHVYFQRLTGNTLGESDVVTRQVFIDLRKDHNPIKTFLHELLHIKYPFASEEKIKVLTNRIWRRMSDRHRFKLGRRLFNRKYQSEDDAE